MSTIKDSCLYYLKLGWSIIPLRGDKRPYFAWNNYRINYATETEVNDWVQKYGEFNIGIICGRLSKLIVIDCDDIPSYEKLLEFFHSINPKYIRTTTVKSGRAGGGMHIYFGISGDYIPAIVVDYRGLKNVKVISEGGYAVAPPSKHQSGNVYTFVNPPDNLVVLTREELISLGLTSTSTSPTALDRTFEIPKQQISIEHLHNLLGDNLGEVDFYHLISVGIREHEDKRNETMLNIVSKLMRQFTELVVIKLYAEYINKMYFKPPLDAKELNSIIESQYKTMATGTGKKIPDDALISINKILGLYDVTLIKIHRVLYENDKTFKIYCRVMSYVDKQYKEINMEIPAEKIWEVRSFTRELFVTTGRMIKEEISKNLWHEVLAFFAQEPPQIDITLRYPYILYERIKEEHERERFIKCKEEADFIMCIKQKKLLIEYNGNIYVNVGWYNIITRFFDIRISREKFDEYMLKFMNAKKVIDGKTYYIGSISNCEENIKKYWNNIAV